MGGAKKTFSASKSDYDLLEEVGYGASATVYRAIYIPTSECVAVKCLDLDRCNSNLDDIRREAQTMSLIDHPNVITAYCSFVVERFLWVIMPFMAEGSCLHLMKIAYPDGFEEPAIASILKETLKALDYLHRHGHIHRDVKAGNILLDKPGIVKLGDFGVSACMFDQGDRQRSRNTFVGTPCWMAPEVLQPGAGYDFKADIWSFGITALELAHGHAPFSKYPPMKVLLMTLQNAPPGLDYERDKRFSKSFKEMVAMCLVKDPTKRPTAEKLLKHSFFKNAKPADVSLKNILMELAPLWDRVKALQLKDAAQLALKKMPSAEQEALSLSEYQRGVSAWNFDIDDLKNQAALIQDDDDYPGIKEDDGSFKLFFNDKDSAKLVGKPVIKDAASLKFDMKDAEKSGTTKIDRPDGNPSSLSSQKRSDEVGKIASEQISKLGKDQVSSQLQKDTGKILVQGNSAMPTSISKSSSGILIDRFDGDNVQPPEKHKRDVRKTPNFSGPLMLPTRASANSFSAPTAPVRSSGYRDTLEDRSKSNVVQIKGRFSVTSENVDIVKDIPICTVPRKNSQGSPLRKSASVGDWSDPKQAPTSQSTKDVNNIAVPASFLIPHLQNLVQQTAFQQDLILNLLSSLQLTEQSDANRSGIQSIAHGQDDETPVDVAASEKEQMLLSKITELQTRMAMLTDELTTVKLKHMQLQQQLNAACNQEEDRSRREDKQTLQQQLNAACNQEEDRSRREDKQTVCED